MCDSCFQTIGCIIRKYWFLNIGGVVLVYLMPQPAMWACVQIFAEQIRVNFNYGF